MQYHDYSSFNLEDSRTRKLYFISIASVLSLFWIISILAYIKDYQVGLAFLICSGCFTFVFLISVIILTCYYRDNNPILPITKAKSVMEIINEINDIE